MRFQLSATKAFVALSTCSQIAASSAGKPGQGKGPPPTITTEDACDNAQVANVLLVGDTVDTSGCLSVTNPGDAYDGTTDNYSCTRNTSAKFNRLVVSNHADRSSIVDGLRVYANKNCEGCDPVKYKVEGRGGPNCYRINVAGVEGGDELVDVDAEATEPFKLISKGELPWIDAVAGSVGRNPIPNQAISSTYEAGDASLTFTEISWVNTGAEGPSECRDYRISFGQARDDTSATIEIGEVELVGMVTSPCTAPTTRSPTSAPTPPPTNAPTPTDFTDSPVCGEPEVANLLFAGDVVETVGCDPATDPENAFDGIISSYQCQVDADNTTNDELIVSNRRRLSVAESLRVYANNDCYDCDPVTFKVEGRGGDNCYRVFDSAAAEGDVVIVEEAAEPFKLIRKGALPWAANTAAEVPRNADGAAIASAYEGGDASLTFTEVDLLNDGELGPAECRDYRVTFDAPRSSTLIKAGEVEIVGRITNACSAFSPTQSPVGCADLVRRVCRNTQGCDWASKVCSPAATGV